MIVASAKNDMLFKRLDDFLQALPQVQRTDVSDLKMRVMTPPIPLPFAVRPTLAYQANRYLMLASVETLIQEALEAKAGKSKNIRSTDEFKNLAQGMPAEGNSFFFASRRFGKALGSLQQQFLKLAAQKSDSDKAAIGLIERLAACFTEGFAYSVSANTDEGWLTVSKSTQQPAQSLWLQRSQSPPSPQPSRCPPSPRPRTRPSGSPASTISGKSTLRK